MSHWKISTRGLSILVTLVIFSQGTQAEILSENVKHHVIVLLDRTGSIYDEDNEDRREAWIELIQTYLTEICFEKSRVIPERRLLEIHDDVQLQDYLSVVSFSLRQFNDFDKFIVEEIGTYIQDYNADIFVQYSEMVQQRAGWNEYKQFFHGWSAISVARPMALAYVKNTQPKAHRTFLLHITDDEYNQENPNVELNWLKDRWEQFERTLSIEIPKEIRKKSMQYFDERELPINSNQEADDRYLIEIGAVKLKLFELVPKADPSVLRNLVKYDSPLTFSRIPGGLYKATFDIDLTRNPMYLPLWLEVRLLESVNQTVIKSHTVADFSQPISLNFMVDTSYRGKALQLETKYGVHFQDDVYGAQILYPQGDALQGAKELQRIIEVNLTPPLKIWGLLPISDRLFTKTIDNSFGYIQNEEEVKKFLDIAIAALLGICIIFTLYMKLVPDRHVRLIILEDK